MNFFLTDWNDRRVSELLHWFEVGYEFIRVHEFDGSRDIIVKSDCGPESFHCHLIVDEFLGDGNTEF